MLKEENIDKDSALIFLPGVKLFLNLDNNIISDMAARMCLFKYGKGEHLIKKGEPGQYMLLIKQGSALVKLEDEDITLGKGDVIGEMALLSGKPSRADVLAQEDTEVLALFRDDFQRLMAKHTKLASVMTDLMRSRLFGKRGINRLGKYKILSQLGEGGMSIVYNAFDTVLEREVAIKMLKYEIASKKGYKERFTKEAKTIAGLKHPNILTVFETIEDYSTEFIVMEKLDGYDLKYFIKNQGVFSSEQTCDILGQVALALDYASNARNGGILHRDIKLANIVIDDQGLVKLMDFGIAMTIGERPTKLEGTLLYMAPEILQLKPFDHRSDIYSMGITAFAMLTGNTPFMSETADTVITQHIEEEPPDISSVVPDIPEELAEFIKRALIKDPEQRISSWNEIQTLLAAGKGGGMHLESSSDKDMAYVIKFKSEKIDTAVLKKELEQCLVWHHAEYEIETIEKKEHNVDFTL